MKKDKIVIFGIVLFFFIILFFNLFVLDKFNNNYILVIFLAVFWCLAKKSIASKAMYNRDKVSVILVVVVLGIIYLLLLYLLGIFVGFYKNIFGLGFITLKTRIIPYSLIIILSELIRSIFINNQNKRVKIFITIALVLVDLVTYIKLYDIFKLESLLSLLGNLIFASISTNLLCNYTNKNYGCIPGICYRIITTIYIYILPILPDIYTFFESVLKIIYPYIIYLVIDFSFKKDNFKRFRNFEKSSTLGLLFTIIVSGAIIALVSCKFKYGIIVVATGSMTGSIDKGDAVIFEQYDKQSINEGTVIIFESEERKVIHRVIDIQQLNNETIYYTKGDANQQKDDGYRTQNDIIAIVKFKIIDIGWPTLFVNELFNK